MYPVVVVVARFAFTLPTLVPLSLGSALPALPLLQQPESEMVCLLGAAPPSLDGQVAVP
jgi:hypothetical protein